MRSDSSSGPVRSYRDLLVWRRAIDLAAECHLLAAEWGRRDRIGLAAQVRRSSASISANIAEGNGRFSRPEYLHFLGIANGSLRETDSHLELAIALGLLTMERAARSRELIDETGRLLMGLVVKLRAPKPRSAPRHSGP